MSDLPSYDEKPTAYLDQNILDSFVEYGMYEFAEELKSEFRIVYSDETLNEIKRSGEYDKKFIKVLNELEAFHIRLKLNNDFSCTNDAILNSSYSPYEVYENYCESEPMYEKLASSFLDTGFKFSGGLSGVGFDEINKKQKESFKELTNHLDTLLKKLPSDTPYLNDLQNFDSEAMSLQFNELQDKSMNAMTEHIKNDKEYSGIKEFREAVKLGPKQLNNIISPNVLEKIFSLYKDNQAYKTKNITIEEFFGLVNDLAFQSKKLYTHQKVTKIYSMLNTLGYYPDTQTHKKRRFIAALSDQSHASMASFCSKVYSGDERFIKKARAAYEFLEIPTIDVEVKFSN